MQGQQSIDGRQYDVVVSQQDGGGWMSERAVVILFKLLSLTFDLRSVVGVRKLEAVIPNENPGCISELF
jgi:hypothetical protein